MGEWLENKWGKITFLFNPEKIDLNVKEKILEEWNRLDNIYKNCWRDFKLGRDKPCVRGNSEFDINWPPSVGTTEKEKLSRFHFLLATATILKHKNKGASRYPIQPELAEAVKKDSKRFYFIENVKHGIATFQDNSVLNLNLNCFYSRFCVHGELCLAVFYVHQMIFSHLLYIRRFQRLRYVYLIIFSWPV
jgi:hypothetical protein